MVTSGYFRHVLFVYLIDFSVFLLNFGSIEEILNVNGIGTAIYEQIKTYITV